METLNKYFILVKKLSLDELQRDSISQFQSKEKFAIRILADHIRSGHNIGSFFRIADSFGFEAVDLFSCSVKPPHPEIHKTAIGATDSVNWNEVFDIDDYLKEKRNQGFIPIVIEQTTASIPLHQYPISKDEKYILIFGNEVHGVCDEILQRCKHFLEIPQFGTKHSLNVSVAAGIVSWHFLNYYLE